MRAVAKTAIGLLALAWIAWAITAAPFRDAEGFPKGLLPVALAGGFSGLLIAGAWGSRWVVAALWGSLALVGHAVMLQWIDAGRAIHYQHYVPASLLEGRNYWLTVLQVLQMALVAAGLWRLWPRLRGWMGRQAKSWRVAAAVAVYVGMSATVSRELWAFPVELAFAVLLQTVNLANLVLAAAAIPSEPLGRLRAHLEHWLGRPSEPANPEPRGVDGFAVAVAVWTTAVAALLCYFVYDRHPHIADEVAYLYHARYLAAGMLDMPAPPASSAFNIDLMQYDPDRWFCPVPPGWPAMLAVGVWSGAPWLMNPILGGINILLAYVLLRHVYSRQIARWSILLLAMSPWYVFMAMNFLTHTFTLTCALFAGIGVALARHTGKVWWALSAGAGIGICSLIRPLDAAILGVVVGVWAIGLGGTRLKWSGLAALALGTVLTAAVALPYNWALTGDPLRSPLMAYTDTLYGAKSNALGFGPERGLGWALDAFPGHSLLESLINAQLNGSAINTELFGWSTGSLLLIMLAVFAGRWAPGDLNMFAVIAAVVGAYSLYWFSGGPDFGARYWYLVVVPCAALAGRGIQYLEQSASGDGAIRIRAGVLALCAMALINFFPWRSFDKYHYYLNMRPDIRALAALPKLDKGLVLIRGRRFPDYASAAIYNPLDLKSAAPIFAWESNKDAREQLLAAYSDRKVWVVDGPSLTQAGYRIVEGPIPAPELLARTLREPLSGSQ